MQVAIETGKEIDGRWPNVELRDKIHSTGLWDEFRTSRRAIPVNDTRPVATDEDGRGSSMCKPFQAAEAAEESFKPGSMNNINESVVTLFPNLHYMWPNIGKLTL